MPAANLRLTIDTTVLAENWRMLSRASGRADCGAAIKADAYGLGAEKIIAALARAGCRDFFVASWPEAVALEPLSGARVAVLHGVQAGEMAAALASAAVPVLCTPAQVLAWRDTANGRECDVMVDTGMNRLGLGVGDLGLLDGLAIDTLHSHLACADTPDHPMNARQLGDFHAVAAAVPHRRASLSASAGIMLGRDYAFGLTRPGIGLYGGVVDGVAAVAGLEARVVQVRDVAPGQSIGYGATWTAARATRVAVLNIGYADGCPAQANAGTVSAGDRHCPVIGRVSMDLLAADVTGADVTEGDWLRLDFDLATVAAATGRSQYELLTGLGHRYARRYQ